MPAFPIFPKKCVYFLQKYKIFLQQFSNEKTSIPKIDWFFSEKQTLDDFSLFFEKKFNVIRQ